MKQTNKLFRKWDLKELHEDPTKGATPQGFDQGLKLEAVVSKMARWRGSE